MRRLGLAKRKQLTCSEYHVSQTVAALHAGKHVFVEKPMALTLSGADEVAVAAKAAGRIVFVGFMRRYAEAFLRVKELVHEAPRGGIAYGKLATLRSLTAVRVRDIIGQVGLRLPSTRHSWRRLQLLC